MSSVEAREHLPLAPIDCQVVDVGLEIRWGWATVLQCLLLRFIPHNADYLRRFQVLLLCSWHLPRIIRSSIDLDNGMFFTAEAHMVLLFQLSSSYSPFAAQS
jgi:hypothetical protein